MRLYNYVCICTHIHMYINILHKYWSIHEIFLYWPVWDCIVLFLFTNKGFCSHHPGDLFAHFWLIVWWQLGAYWFQKGCAGRASTFKFVWSCWPCKLHWRQWTVPEAINSIASPAAFAGGLLCLRLSPDGVGPNWNQSMLDVEVLQPRL